LAFITALRILSLVLLLAIWSRAQETGTSLKTRAELSNYQETSRYADVLAFFGRLEKESPLLHLQTFGRTHEGRDLPLVIISEPPLTTPREARDSGKTLVFVLANIHAGEVEGKEACQDIAKRLTTGDLRQLLKKVVVLMAPIYNADGNERISLTNRTEQNGPIGGVGTRENSQGLDLNRDFMKVEAPETKALLQLFNEWAPHLTVDLHTTDGSYHGYHLTYSPPLNPSGDGPLLEYHRKKMMPALTKALLRHYGFRSYYYGNFASEASLSRQDIYRGEAKGEPNEPKIWRAFSPQPRVGFNYVGLRNRLFILSEAYSYLDFRRRIAVTEAFVTEILKYSAANAAEIRRLTREADARMIALARNEYGGASVPASRQSPKERHIAVEYTPKALPKPVPILVGEVVKKTNALSGHEMTAMVEDAVTPVNMLDYGLFAAARSVPIARAYLIPHKEGVGIMVEKLRAHGIVVEELARPLTTDVQSFTVEKVTRSPRRIQGHDNVKVTWRPEEERIRFEPGTYVVRTSQPLGLLAAYLLEPESDDALVSWNFLDAFLEPQKVLPVYKLMRTRDLKRVEIRSPKSEERQIQNH
jgi:hypothetical protein